EHDFIQYKKIHAQVKRHMMAKRQAFDQFTQRINETKSNLLVWRYLKAVMHPEAAPPIADMLQLNNCTADEASTQVTDFFAEMVGAHLSPEPVPEPYPSPEACWLDMCRPFLQEELQRALATTRNSAPGADGIRITALKHLSEQGRQRLLNTYN